MKERDGPFRHEIFSAPSLDKILASGDWIRKNFPGIENVILAQRDLRTSRLVVASMLTEAWNEEAFYEANSRRSLSPTEKERMNLIAYLQRTASAGCLLSSDEIRKIQVNEGRVSLEEFKYQDQGKLPSFDQLAEQVRRWHEQDLVVGCFHGSFDPSTWAHLSCATNARFQCDRLLIGFGGDRLIKRKGADRPRSGSAESRRRVLDPFWMTDGTFVLRAEKIDKEQFAADYRALSIDVVFLARDQEDMESRVEAIEMAGARVGFVETPNPDFRSSGVWRLAEERDRQLGIRS